MQVVNTSNIFQRIVFARLSRSDPLRCSVLQCPVSQLCSWEARSKQTCVKNLRSNDFFWRGVCSLVGSLIAWWEARRGWEVRARWLHRGWGSLVRPHLNLDLTFIACTRLRIPATGSCWKLAFVANFHHPWWHLKQGIESNCIFKHRNGWYVYL